jgi:hypothetical protein
VCDRHGVGMCVCECASRPQWRTELEAAGLGGFHPFRASSNIPIQIVHGSRFTLFTGLGGFYPSGLDPTFPSAAAAAAAAAATAAAGQVPPARRPGPGPALREPLLGEGLGGPAPAPPGSRHCRRRRRKGRGVSRGPAAPPRPSGTWMWMGREPRAGCAGGRVTSGRRCWASSACRAQEGPSLRAPRLAERAWRKAPAGARRKRAAGRLRRRHGNGGGIPVPGGYGLRTCHSTAGRASPASRSESSWKPPRQEGSGPGRSSFRPRKVASLWCYVE